MSAAWQFYIITLLVYTGVNVTAAWALNLQFGVGGILNFGFIIFQAIGAYVASVLTLGPASASGGYQSYILGANLPWPLPLLAAGLAGALLALVVGLFALRPRRTDYQGMVLLTVAIITSTVVSDQVGLFNGASGLAGVPRPLVSLFNVGLVGYGWFYTGLTALVMLVVYFFVHRLTNSPWGRQVRSIRENPSAAEALGINVNLRRMQAFVCGGAIAAVSGALLVQFIGAWAPGSWSINETFLFFTCIVIGGLGNNFGAAFGTVLVLTVVINGVLYLPIFSYTNLAEALQLAALGVLIVIFLWARPRGIFPERKRKFASSSRSVPKVIVAPPGAAQVEAER
jgi:branched-chain amino acid transport system permease protein